MGVKLLRFLWMTLDVSLLYAMDQNETGWYSTAKMTLDVNFQV